MAKHFATILPNGLEMAFAKNQCFQANQVQNYGEGQRFFLSGAEVAAEAYYAEVKTLCDAWYEQKNETHKLVRVRYGTSFACYVWKWIPR
jgi:hypothetical protein